MIRRSLFMLALLLFAAAVAAQEDDLDTAFSKDVLIIEASEFACYRFDIYIAATSEQTRRGLMHVRHLPLMTGMLFVYGSDDYYSMWMKNTLIPLDMLFIRSDGTVSSIISNTEPHSLESRGAIEPVRYVLELNAGVAARFSIDENSRVLLYPAAGADE